MSEPNPPPKDGADESWVPKVGMEFESEVDAYQFYDNYAKRIGFSIRKNRLNRRSSGVISLRVYVCHKEGFRGNKKEEWEVKNPKLYERTGCLAALTLKITKNGKYRVTDFEARHNHPLVIPNKAHMIKWRRISKDRGVVAEESGMIPRVADEVMNGHAGGHQHLIHPSQAYKNYLQSNRASAVVLGDAGALLQYVQERQIDDPSFFYAVQLDKEDRVANIFWADGLSIIDYDYFGDAVCFDTTYRSNNYGRPFAQFIGVNHHMQMVFFGAALLYNETTESFKWLFETFKAAMSGKQPKGSKTFALDFSKCIYEIEEEEEFQSSWKEMLETYDLKDNQWLAKLYEDREKWALPYSRHIFCADMKSTLRNEGLSAELKQWLCPELDLLQFLNHYEKAIDGRRHAELQADFQACQISPTIPPTRMLRQAANIYTPVVFKMFQREFEMSMDCLVYGGGELGPIADYKVAAEGDPTEYVVRVDISDGTIICSCKKFEFMGIQCRHVLKVLDVINIKELPQRYILKRWRKDAKAGSTRDNCEFAFIGDSTSSKAKRYSSLCRIFNKIAARAAESLEAYTLIEGHLDQLMDHVYQLMQSKPFEKH
ncbi:protein FAR1-RELATED SEQUENCE 5-like isoform X2 [Phoenix dactylifera]|uniref:Protein FAR1-RELATED SEQUENCE n=1 Tax=Phoenix dactylifera TaxID=42345 RepID=A0A8B8J8Q8_PHODC|nr:protein FAR1-RELATED SEQUENCE 5-like isoform X2 [Phoenix dactylifera]